MRSVFKFGYDAGLIDRPVRFGPSFKKPTRKVMRQHRAKNGLRMFEAAELRTIIAAATQPMKSMVLLGINCGFGNGDVANLPLKALDLKAGWVTFPRPKTGIDRRIPLWPETIAAIKEAIQDRPKAKDRADAGLVFITVQGHRWEKTAISDPDPETGKIRIKNNNAVTQEFIKLLRRLKLKRPGLAFYGFATRSKPWPGPPRIRWPSMPSWATLDNRDMAASLPRADRRRPPEGRGRLRPRLALPGRQDKARESCEEASPGIELPAECQQLLEFVKNSRYARLHGGRIG